jgi:hypothetical protein
MERAFTNIGRTTAEVDYVELHATGKLFLTEPN